MTTKQITIDIAPTRRGCIVTATCDGKKHQAVAATPRQVKLAVAELIEAIYAPEAAAGKIPRE